MKDELKSEHKAAETELTVSRLWIYLTWASTDKMSFSELLAEPPATPGPDTNAISADKDRGCCLFDESEPSARKSTKR